MNKEFVIDRFCRFKLNFREGICADHLSCAAHAQYCAEGRIVRVGMPSDPRNLHPRRRKNDHRETQQKWENKRKCSHAVRAPILTSNMFSSNFLSGGNPLSAMSSAVNKFSLFGDETSEEKQQQQPPGPSKPKDSQQQGNNQPSGQQASGVGRGSQGAGRGGAQPQGPGRGGPVQQGGGRGGVSQQGTGRGGMQQGVGRGGSPQQGPRRLGAGAAESGSPPTEAGKSEPQMKGGPGVKSLCPVCKNTELNLKSKDSPNRNTCTQCKSVVCNMCGFSPPDASAKEWLCLNCQMQRALGGVDSSGPPMQKAQPQPKGPIPSQNPGMHNVSPAKKDTAQIKQTPPSASHPSKPTEGQKTSSQPSPSTANTNIAAHQSQQKPQQKMKGASTPTKSEPPSKTEPPKEDSGFFGFGFGGARSRSPSPQPGGSSVSGKVMGFGSSFLSSASNLISSVQDEHSTTPPTSRKGSAVSQTSAKMTTPPPSRKESETSKDSPNLHKPQTRDEKMLQKDAEQAKTTVMQTKSASNVDQSLKVPPKACPLCKASLKKDPPNYSTCTECKTIVCNQCGFNPVPHQTEAKEWLCLNCQTQRALKGMESSGQPIMKSPKQPQKSVKMDSTLGSVAKQQPATQPASQKNETSSTEAKQPPTPKPFQQQKEKHNPGPPVSKPPPKTEPQQEQGFFGFGFSGARSRSPPPQPPVSAVSGKVLGFGSSFLSSASNLISSAVEDESTKQSTSQNTLKTTTTPPTSRKGSTTSHGAATTTTAEKANPLSSQKDNKTEPTADQKNKALLSQAKKAEPSLQMPKADKGTKPLVKSCPLCKVEIKMDPINYSTCTECKNTVCNLCGFNPIPHQTEVKEWRCLNCQTQRALRGMEPPGPPKMEMSGQPNNVPVTQPLSSPSVQKKQASDLEKAGKKIEPPQKLQEQQTKAPNGSLPIQIVQRQENEAKSEAPGKSLKEESGFFGFGARSRSPSPQPAVSAVSGKVLGFGSSFLSSASNLISSTVQDDTSNTPPTSRKGSTVSQTSNKTTPTPPTPRKGSAAPQDSKTRKDTTVSQSSQKNATPPTSGSSAVPQTTNTAVKALATSAECTGDAKQPSSQKQEKKISELPQLASTPSVQAKTDQALLSTNDKSPLPIPKTCPLCKANISSDPPNFSTCTDCKNTVCNLCGFNPMPHQKEVKEWLCLNCQIKRAHVAPSLNPQVQANAGSQQDRKPPVQQAAGTTKNQTTTVGKPTATSAAQKPQMEKPHPQQDTSKQLPKNARTSEKSASKAEPSKEESGFFGFGFGGARSRSSSPQPAVSDKVLGFGSSFLSSASNLISSVVQDESSTTPPTPRKGSTVSQTSVKSATLPSSRKGSLVSQTPPKTTAELSTDISRKGSAAFQDLTKLPQATEDKSLTHRKMEDKPSAQVDSSPSQPRATDKSSKSPPKECPLCKVELKKNPPNFNTCTECKKIVCNLCGFNPNPNQTEAKEWLCLTCQMQRASMSSHAEPQEQAKKLGPVPKKETTQESLQKKQNPMDATNTAVGKKEHVDSPTKMPSQPKTSEQEKSDKPLEKQPEPPSKAQLHQEESGIFGFGFGGARSRSPSPQPAVSAVSGKVLGFGSSFLSSASNLISSAVHEPSTTPPTSRKGSSVSETTPLAGSRKGSVMSESSFKSNTTPPSSRKGSETMQDSQKDQSTKETKPSVPRKEDEKRQEKSLLVQQAREPSDNVKDDKLGTQKALSRPIPKICPLCKVELKKDQCNSCSECKNTVCNLCGFNPAPHEYEGKWLCLACQMQKAPEPSPVQPRPSTKEVAPPKKDTPTPDTSQKNPAAATQKKPVAEKTRKQTLGETKQPTQKETSQPQPHMAQVPTEFQKTEPQDKTGFFGFGFGGARSRSPSPQPAASAVSGKVLGFGSSIINSASNLISSAVQDETSATPSGSRKASVVSQMYDKTPPTSRKGSAISQTTNTVKTTPLSSRKGSAVSQTSVKTLPTSQKESEAVLNSEAIKNVSWTKTELAEKQESAVERQVEQSSTDQLPKKAAPQQEQEKQDGAAPDSSKPPEESGFFGFGKSQSPLHQPTASSVSGKVLGFGSSFLSSASNLISSALDETTTSPPNSRKGSTSSQLSNKTTTPPSSRKGSSVSQTSDKITTPPSSQKGSIKTSTLLSSQKGPEDLKASSKTQLSDDKKVHPANIQEQIKTDEKKSDVSPAQTTSPAVIKYVPPKTTKTESTKSLPKTCPLCMVDLKLDPPNYDTCTKCKKTVCTLCGFNPMPNETEKKQWLCLSCQMQRAQVEANKVPPPPSQLKKETLPVSQQKPVGSTDATEKQQTLSASATPESKPQSSVPPTQKTPQQQDHNVSGKYTTPQKTGSTKEEAGFFGFGRSRSPSPQPAVSGVSGKVLGFGSSLLSSASNLISTAVQDESSASLQASQEVSTASQTFMKTTLTPATSEKGSANLPPIQGANSEKEKGKENKAEKKMTVQGNVITKEGEQKSELPKACPLCKAELTKNSSNYNTCTSCKSIVCNLCGFNPVPHQTAAKEWLCLNCQMQRAPEPPQARPQATKKPLLALPQKQTTPIPISSQSKPSILAEDQNLSVSGKQESKSNVADSRQHATNKSEAQKNKSDVSAAKSDQPPKPKPPKEDSDFFSFGFGSSRSRSPSPQPTVSAVSGKVLGFSSSFLSSASNLINSAVQDETSKTPLTSRKGSTVSQTSIKISPTPPASGKGSVTAQDLTQKPEVESKTPSTPTEVANQIATEKTSEQVKPSQTPVKEEHLKTCPLCKETLKEDPQNYSTCTSCKSTVCNLCGFNPNPHQTEVKEWLCLACQMQKMPEPLPAHPQPQSNKVSPPASPQKKETPAAPSPEKRSNVLAEQDKKPPVDTKKPVLTPTSPNVQMSKGDASPSKSTSQHKGEQIKEESGFFGFGLGGARSPSPQPAVSENVFGFGSSFLSSASNLISSAVQDESTKSPQTSHKGSTLFQTSDKSMPTPPASRKGSVAPQDSKQTTHAGESKPVPAPPQKKNGLVEKSPNPQPTKPHAADELPRACPLCKETLKKDPQNYSSCSSCKNIVCNLCGFNPSPHQTEVNEWICLTCQIQKVPGPPPAQPQSSKVTPPALSEKKESPVPPSPEKKPSVPVEQDKKPPAETKTPTPSQTTANAQISKSYVSPKSGPAPKGDQTKEESGFFGFGGARSRSPSPQTAVSEKVFGFGSSFLSSASNLISSAVQDESSKKTPPTSRKGSTVSQSSVKMAPTPPASRKGSEAPQKIVPAEEAKPTTARKPDEKKRQEVKSQDEMPKVPVAEVTSRKTAPEPLKACPLCKVDLKQDPPNYNTCSECKNIVCNLCGFNPMPHQTGVKEWLCLNCQMKSAPGSTSAQPRPPVNKALPPTIQQNKEIPKPFPIPVSPQEKLNEKDKTTDAVENQEKTSTKQSTTSTAQPDASPTKPAVPSKPEPAKDEPGFFRFGFSGPRSGSPQPSVTAVSGKVLGFGSSFLSSASNLISSAVQDESSTTPPSSRKASTVSEKSAKSSTPPTSRRESVVSHISEKTTPTPPASRKGSVAQQTSDKVPPTADSTIAVTEKPKEDIPSKKEMQQGTTTSKALAGAHEPPKAQTKACPLCKVDLNVGSQDIPNYSTCTECKNVVCNLCGFNPTPHRTEVKEWLCLNCQTQRALNEMGPQEPAKLKSSEQADNVSMSAPAPIKPEAPSLVSTKVAPDIIEIQKKDVYQVQLETKLPKPNEVQAAGVTDHTKTPKDVQKKETTLASEKLSESTIKAQPASSEKKETSAPKEPTKEKELEKSPSKFASPPQAEPPKQESSFFGLGFGGPKVQPAASKPRESATGKLFGGLTEAARSRSPSPQTVSAVSGKVLGFGSSIFSSASNLITSAVQDESSTTPPTSRKGSTVSQTTVKTTPPTSRKGSTAAPDSKVLSIGDVKPYVAEKHAEGKPEVKQVAISQPPQKPVSQAVQHTCPICKVHLNTGSKDAKNFTLCTECKTTVCSQCGFNPMPPQSEVKEWLCLNCQVQRANSGIEASENTPVKPQSVPLVKDSQSLSKVDKLATAPFEAKADEQSSIAAAEKKVAFDKEVNKNMTVPGPQQKPDVIATQSITRSKELPKQNNQQPEPAKPSHQAPKDAVPPAKSAPLPHAEPPKQESSFFGFGLGGAKAQPASSKPAEKNAGKLFGFGGLTETARSRSPSPQSVSAVSGKVLGFGSSLFSSASSLISSAVQDEPSTTPPTSRKASTVSAESVKSSTTPTASKGSLASQNSPKGMPPASHKGSVATPDSNKVPPAKDTKTPSEKKSGVSETEQLKVSKITEEKDKPETKQEKLKHVEGVPQSAASTCPLCNVDLNMDSKDPPNFNTCTE
ncbi:putative protein piccolo, partial [Triplophysa rosa]